MKLFRHLMTLGTLMLLSACAMTIRNDVTSFHHMPAPAGEAVAIIPMNLALDPDDLEFKEYAALVSKQLVMLGYSITSKQDADLIFELGYAVKRDSDRRRDLFRRDLFGVYDPWSSYGYGYYNWYYWRHNSLFYRYHDPFYGPWGRGYAGRIMYNRNLMLDVRTTEGDKIYQGRVESLGSTRSLVRVMPLMIEAMFVDFPGESNAVKRIVIREDDKK